MTVANWKGRGRKWPQPILRNRNICLEDWGNR